MKKLMPSTQSGQALVMIALAAIGLFGFAALAIDGSAIFSDRRHAQNAADTGCSRPRLRKCAAAIGKETDWDVPKAMVTMITGLRTMCCSTILPLMDLIKAIINIFRSRSGRMSNCSLHGS